ncbi:MAG: hypothetical protein QOF69_1413 [Solirubrobacteraceae bacterium]|nr:hypothetical protein [Solirubrobacteraceae bacterium]
MGVPGRPDDRAPALRASDAERDHAVARLRDGASEGRLTFDELAHRVELAYAAATTAELDELLADLPAASATARTETKPVPRGKQRRWNVAIMGGCERRGRWRPSPHSVAIALMGGVSLDLRDASIEEEELVITAFALMGGVEVIVPEGVEVDLGGLAIMGGNEHRPGTAPVRPGTPIVRIRAFSLMGGTEVKARGSRSAERARKELKHG